ncbi:MAG: hypothetical protein JXR53_08420 [Bacteroidales bacterium]|nr:hypothetical protein [Bacteroidales bacterium]
MRKTILTGLLGLILFSCSKEIEKPIACLNAPSKAFAGEQIDLISCSANAEFISIWTGDTTHVYELRNDTLMVDKRGNIIENTGFDITTTQQMKYSYKEAGTYIITLVASKSEEDGRVLYQSESSHVINILAN